MSQEPHYEWAGEDCEDAANELRHGRQQSQPKDLSGCAFVACYLILIWSSICIIYQTTQSLGWLWSLVTGGAE